MAHVMSGDEGVQNGLLGFCIAAGLFAVIVAVVVGAAAIAA